jgi:hypothetical protein
MVTFQRSLRRINTIHIYDAKHRWLSLRERRAAAGTSGSVMPVCHRYFSGLNVPASHLTPRLLPPPSPPPPPPCPLQMPPRGRVVPASPPSAPSAHGARLLIDAPAPAPSEIAALAPVGNVDLISIRTLSSFTAGSLKQPPFLCIPPPTTQSPPLTHQALMSFASLPPPAVVIWTSGFFPAIAVCGRTLARALVYDPRADQTRCSAAAWHKCSVP